MAKLEDLIAQVANSELRGALEVEAQELKRRKRFGLVFEEHIPEICALPNLTVEEGSTVRDRTENIGALYRVLSIKEEVARLVPLAAEDQAEERPLRDLQVIKRFGEPVYTALTSLDAISRGRDRPWHAVIKGENFHALQMLLYLYEGEVDCIYIDPPYNSGTQKWKYNNRFVDEADSWRHSKWLAFMQKRLLLAKRLLKRDDGVLICSIDENEVHHLGTLLDQIFPEYDRTMITAVTNPKGTGANNFARVDEYVFFLTPAGRQIIEAVPHDFGLPVKPKKDTRRARDRSGQHYRRLALRRDGAESSNRFDRPRQFYAIYVDRKTKDVVGIGPELAPNDNAFDTAERDGRVPVYPIDRSGRHRVWRYSRDTMTRCISAQEIRVTGHDEERDTYTLYRFKPIPAEEAERRRPRTVWWHASHDAGAHGSSLLNTYLGVRSSFPFPKSVYAVADCLRLVVRDRPDALILDYFAGSGTTLHATCLLNLEDDGQRRSIMVTNNEVGLDVSTSLNNEGTYQGDKEFERNGIFEAVTRPRSTAVVTGKRPDGQPVEGEHVWANRRPYAAGFEENVEFFELDYLDPNEIDLGWQFRAILPALWLRAGGIGTRPKKASGPILMPNNTNFAVLFEESRIRDITALLEARPDVTHVYLVTDSTEAFAEMRALLSSSLKVSMLYRDYLRNFEINTRVRA